MGHYLTEVSHSGLSVIMCTFHEFRSNDIMMTGITKIIIPGFPYVEAFKSCVFIQVKQLDSTFS